ncbi:MAG: hypothetical protein ACPGUV_14630, partial [Polyangiales bacterium]
AGTLALGLMLPRALVLQLEAQAMLPDWQGTGASEVRLGEGRSLLTLTRHWPVGRHWCWGPLWAVGARWLRVRTVALVPPSAQMRWQPLLGGGVQLQWALGRGWAWAWQGRGSVALTQDRYQIAPVGTVARSARADVQLWTHMIWRSRW